MFRIQSKRKNPNAALILSLAVFFVLLGAFLVSAFAADSTVKVIASADTYATAQAPATPHGSLTIIRTDGSPKRIAYVKFNVPTLNTSSSTAVKIVFKVHAEQSTAGYTLYSTSNSWTEAGLTYNNRPALGTVVGSVGQTGAGWTNVNLTTHIKKAGTYSFAMVAKNDLATNYTSTEASTYKPQLIITYTSITTTPTSTTDTQAPTTPTNLAIGTATSSGVQLNWKGSTDDVGVIGYDVSRDGTLIGSTNAATLHYTDNSTSAGGDSQYEVDAYDAAGNVSDTSNAVSVTAPDVPNVPTNLTATATSANAVKLNWSETITNGLDHFNIIRNDEVVASVQLPVFSGTPPATITGTYTDTGLAANTSYTYAVSAVNSANSESAPSSLVTVKTPAGTSTDTQAPTAPTGLAATAPTYNQVNLSWNASTDNVGVAGYRIFRGTTQLAQVSGTTHSFADSTVAANTTYSYSVKAYDAAGNVSTASASVSVKTPSQTPPPCTSNCGGGGTISSTTPCSDVATAPSKYKHIVVILMENKTYSTVIGTSSAPYINSLVAKCGTNTNYSDAGSQYNSLSNYIALTSGSVPGTGGVTTLNDCSYSSGCHAPVDNIFRQVRTAGGTAKSFEESMPSNCATSNSGNYAMKHNPAVYYDAGSDRQACQSDDVPMGSVSSGALKSALASDSSLPTFSFLTPNMCDDMHDCSVATGDKWIQSWMPTILDSAPYKTGDTAVFLLWDEDTHIPNVFIAPSIKAGTKSSTAISHYSTLRTWEEMLGINSFLGKAASSNSERSIFNF